jgi:DNA-binding CsgD family transcriptional regulator
MGYSIKEMARQLQITTRTCQFYIENARQKLHFYTKKELLEAFRKLLIDKLPLS